MDSVMSTVVGFALVLYYYFLRMPILVGAIVFLFYALRYFVMKKKTRCFWVRSDFIVILLTSPFWGVCTLLPGVTTKSIANLCELMLLGYLWSAILFVRMVLAGYNVAKYNFYAHVGNVLLFFICVIVAYCFPTLPE